MHQARPSKCSWFCSGSDWFRESQISAKPITFFGCSTTKQEAQGQIPITMATVPRTRGGAKKLRTSTCDQSKEDISAVFQKLEEGARFQIIHNTLPEFKGATLAVTRKENVLTQDGPDTRVSFKVISGCDTATVNYVYASETSGVSVKLSAQEVQKLVCSWCSYTFFTTCMAHIFFSLSRKQVKSHRRKLVTPALLVKSLHILSRQSQMSPANLS